MTQNINEVEQSNITAAEWEKEQAEYFETLEMIEDYCEKENISDIVDDIPW